MNTDSLDGISLECSAVIKVDCPHCHAPAGSHCANRISSIVWPPHACRMDAYKYRLHESEDWPLVTPVVTGLEYVKNIKAPLLWKAMVAQHLLFLHSEQPAD